MKIKTVLAPAGIAAVLLAVSAPLASAADDRNCSDFASPIIITNGFDPAHLDADYDGIGCESNPGQAVRSDLYADLRGEGDTSPDPSLAATGAGDVVQRHPLRAIGAAGLSIGAGTITILVVRCRTRNKGA